jgi:hypothetical protein
MSIDVYIKDEFLNLDDSSGLVAELDLRIRKPVSASVEEVSNPPLGNEEA